MFKKIMLVGLVAALCSCGELEKVKVTGIDGTDGNIGTDGAAGQDGYNSLLRMFELETNSEICLSGKGILVAAGLDLNRNNLLDSEEIVESSIAAICDGATGPQGPDGSVGPAGEDGADGIDGIDGIDGLDGIDGQDGIAGQDGQDGQDGSDGQDGEDGIGLHLYAYALTTTCQSVGNGYYAEKVGSNSKIYTDALCDDVVASLVENSDEVYITSALMFLVEEGPSSVTLYKIVF